MSADKRWGIFAFAIIVGAATIYWLGPLKTHHQAMEKSVFIPLKIEGFSPGDIPYCTIYLDSETILASIDLGFEGQLSLPANFLDKIKNKRLLKKSKRYGLYGNPYPVDEYEINKITIANCDFLPQRVQEMSPQLEDEIVLVKNENEPVKEMGRIGWHLFESFNLLVDCKNQKFVLCDNLETLKKKSYPVESFTKIPFVLKNGLIEFEAITDMGPIWCILDTGSTWNMYNQYDRASHIEKPLFDLKDTFDTQSFQIGNKNFGPITFNRIYSPAPLQAIIGMEFFRDTLVYIDFKEQMLYFYEYPRP